MALQNSRTGEEVKIGQRVLCEDHYGTIRYIGEVPPTQGVWLGVEWDNPSRGKHSGTHEGERYFTCSVEGSGSFIRPKKANFGTTFIQAVEERYKGGMVEEELYVDVKPVEMVGMERHAQKQSRLHKLREMSVSDMLVSSAGPPNEIASITPGVVELDLTHNLLLSGWETVTEITSQLKLLRTLNLSENKQLLLPAEGLSKTPAFSTVTAAYLNKMCLTWNMVAGILKMMPNLEELHACENKIETISEEAIPGRLHLLNLEENEISDWSAVLRLRSLTQLKTLILNDNKLDSLSRHVVSADDFVNVKCLHLSRNAIRDWSSVNSLAAWPALRDLHFKTNPLNEGESVFSMRQLLIARLGNLTHLNNSSISAKERLLAERLYVKRYASEYVEATKGTVSLSTFHKAHPRYAHLVSVHDLPLEVKESAKEKPPTSAPTTGLIYVFAMHDPAVHIRCPDNPQEKELTKKLPVTMTVQKLKGLLQRLYKVDSSEQRLSYLDQHGTHEIELDDNLKQLYFYSIEEGDTILLRWSHQSPD